MAFIIAPDDPDDDTFVFGTALADTILCGARGAYYGLGGNDNIRQGNTNRLQEPVMLFGGSGLHDTRDLPFRFAAPMRTAATTLST